MITAIFLASENLGTLQYVETINFNTLNYLNSSLNLEDYVRGTVIAMSAPQIIGAHQPHQACTLFRNHSHNRVEEGAQQLGQLSHTVRTPQPRDWGSLFNF